MMSKHKTLQSFALGELGEVIYDKTKYQFLSLREEYGRNFKEEAERIKNNKIDILFHRLVDDTHVFIVKEGKFKPDVPKSMVAGSKGFNKIRDQAGKVFGENWEEDSLT